MCGYGVPGTVREGSFSLCFLVESITKKEELMYAEQALTVVQPNEAPDPFCCCSPETTSAFQVLPKRGTCTREALCMPSAILVIDSSMTVRTIIRDCLARDGFLVVTFADGFQTLRWLSAQPVFQPDVILLERETPRLDWYEVARRLQAHPACSQSILVLLSQRDGTLDRIKALLLGAQDSLTKPFRVQDLRAVIQRCLSLSGGRSHAHQRD